MSRRMEHHRRSRRGLPPGSRIVPGDVPRRKPNHKFYRRSRHRNVECTTTTKAFEGPNSGEVTIFENRRQTNRLRCGSHRSRPAAARTRGPRMHRGCHECRTPGGPSGSLTAQRSTCSRRPGSGIGEEDVLNPVRHTSCGVGQGERMRGSLPKGPSHGPPASDTVSRTSASGPDGFNAPVPDRRRILVGQRSACSPRSATSWTR